MKLSRQFTVFGSAIFCVVIFSLYLMLDRGHLDYPKSPRREGSFPQGQLSMLQEKIDHLERLLAENNEIISNIRDSVINLSESVEDGTKNSKGNFSHGAGSPLLPAKRPPLAVDPGDCLFASQSGSHSPDVQMLDVYSLIPFDNPDGGVWKQGFDITYKPDEWDTKPLQVFVVPHSHNDPGWLKTFDDYFREKTQYIFNNMVVKLKEDPRRKFIWSEISYLSKWWETIDVQKKDAVKSLLESGQFEIVTGGWVMPDEAGAHYSAIIDQLIEGHQWLERNLEYIMRNAGLEETQAGIKIVGRNINSLRYADDTTLMAESEEELKSLLMKVKEESEKVGLKLNIQKTKIMASGPITSWEIDGETVETVSDFIFWAPKSLQMVTAAMK